MKGITTCREQIEASLPDSAEVLLSPKAMESLKELAAHFPPLFCGFEVRLLPASHKVDFGCGFQQPMEWLRWIQSPQYPDQFRSLSEWGRICEFIRIWNDKESLIGQCVTACLLEFDCDSEEHLSPVPAVFFYYQDIFAQHRINKGLALESLSHTYKVLRDMEMEDGLKAQCRACLEALPEGASLMGAGMFLSREKTPLRLTTTLLTWHECQAYLEKVGYQEDQEHFMEMQSLLGKDAKVSLALDVVPEGVGRVGYITFSFVEGERTFSPIPLPKEQYEAWKQWKQVTALATDSASAALLDAKAFAPHAKLLRTRGTFHFKFGKNREGEWEVKVYLYLLDMLYTP